ncbi:chaperonin 10-like protein [Mycena rosella]|uniref:Chaperonin 10-like protein n=1 Tax=Mycena rosella TaxID=1033263 RepID=A0AAD7GLS3_MYCRO|nr:chaperonin 10-like protein [Mycena rosella]
MSTQQQHTVIIPSAKAPLIVGPREVLIKVMSVALNPVDWAKHAHDFLIPEYPAVLGCDIAGVVEALGGGAGEFKKGDKVFVQTLSDGFQQYTTAPAATVMPIPENVNFDEAATFPITFTTACVGLFAPSPIGAGLNPTFSWDKPRQGESALVIGAGTSHGANPPLAIQLLKFSGFTRIVAYASKIHFDYLRELGATECIDRAEVSIDSLAAHINAPVNVVYDGTDGGLNAAYDCLVNGGSIVAAQPRTKCDREGKKFTLIRAMGYIAGPEIFKVNAPTPLCPRPEHTTFGKLIMKNLPEMLAKRVIVGNRCEVLPNGLAGIPGALGRFGDAGVTGVKLVAHPQDPVA